jgi:hypothetical protein
VQSQIQGPQIRSSSMGAVYNMDAHISPQKSRSHAKFKALEGQHEASLIMKIHKYQSPPHHIKSSRRSDAGEFCISVEGRTRTKVYDSKFMSPQRITVRRPYDLNFLFTTRQF